MTAGHSPLDAFPFQPLDPETLAQVLEELGDAERGCVDPATVSARRIPLTYQPGVDLIELTHPDWLPKGARLAFFRTPEGLVRLTGASLEIHDTNRRFPLRLDRPEAALAYLSFFCFFVRGEDVPFVILDDPDSPILTDLPDRAGLSALWKRPRTFGRDAEGKWRCTAMVWYANAIFSSDFLVAPSGMIEMLTDEPLRTDLTAFAQAPLEVAGRTAPQRD